MFGMSKGKGPQPQPAGGVRIPTEKVVSLSAQGMSEPEIIRSLKDEGYSPLEVDRAMKQALRSGTSGPVQQPSAMSAPPMPMPRAQQPPQGFDPYSQRMQEQRFQAPPAPGPQEQRDRFAPTMWDTDEEDMEDDDLDKELPKERQAGPDKFLSNMDEDLPPLPPERGEKEPIPFQETPLPKDRDDRMRELRDRKRREMEELAEEITDEKAQEVSVRMHALEERMDKIASAVKSGLSVGSAGGASPADLDMMKKDFEDLRHSVEETNARIDSLEEVVKTSLTPMIESVRKFSSAVKTARQPQAPMSPQYAQPPEA